jgi:hypothetical protein
VEETAVPRLLHSAIFSTKELSLREKLERRLADMTFFSGDSCMVLTLRSYVDLSETSDLGGEKDESSDFCGEGVLEIGSDGSA